jgi:hypothetical protein
MRAIISMPSKPKYVISIKEKTIIRENLLFEFYEREQNHESFYG